MNFGSNPQQSILEAIIANYSTPSFDTSLAGMMPAGAAPQMAGQPPQQPQAAPQPQAGPSAPVGVQAGAPQGPMGPPPPVQDPLADVEGALQAGLSQPDATDKALAFEAGAAPFEKRWADTQEQNWRGLAGGIEWMVDKYRAKKMAPQRQAVDEGRARMMYEKQQDDQLKRAKRRAAALIQLGNTEEQAAAIAASHMSDDSFDPSKYDRTDPGTKAKERAERKAFIDENPQLAQSFDRKALDQFWATGSFGSSDGMSMTMDPESGFFSFTTGDGQTHHVPPTSGTMTDAQKRILNYEVSERKLTDLQNKSRKSYVGLGGRIASKVGEGLDWLGASDNDLAEYAGERSAWVNQVLDDVMAFRKEITGVAGGPVEMAKIEAMRANPSMGAAAFEENMSSIINSIRRDQNVLREGAGLDVVQKEPFVWKWGGDEEEEPIEDIMSRY